MVEGNLGPWLPVSGDLEGKKARWLIVPKIDFDQCFPLCCGHVSMPRTSVPQRIGLPPPVGVGSKRSFLAEWLGEAEVCGSESFLLLIHSFNRSSRFQPCPSSYPRFLLSWFLSLCGVQRFGLGSFVGSSVWLRSFLPSFSCSVTTSLVPPSLSEAILLIPYCVFSRFTVIVLVLCIYCPLSWLEERGTPCTCLICCV